MLDYLTLDDIAYKNKTIGVRIDINSPVIKNKVVLNERIRQSCSTIKELIKGGAKVVLLAHQGRKGKDDFVSLKQHAKLLSQELKEGVVFMPEVYSEEVVKVISELNSGEILLLENVRFVDDEKDFKKKGNVFTKLEQSFDYYVYDAFSVSHRVQATVVNFKKKSMVAGRLMEKELNGLSSIQDRKKERMFLFGGTKPDDLLVLMKSALKQKSVSEIFLTGVIGELALYSKGYYLGKKVEFLKKEGYLESVDELSKLMKTYPSKIIIPKDVAYLNAKKERVEVSVEDLEKNKKQLDTFSIEDIGQKTIEFNTLLFDHADAIYVKGPAGNFEKKGMEVGSKKLLEAVTKSRAFSFMGGGHSVTAAERFKVLKKFSYVSLAGGALVSFLSGETLPGVKALEESYKRHEKELYDMIVVGSNTLDYCVKVDKQYSDIKLGDKVKVKEDFKETIGGGGYNVSLAMSRLGGHIAYLGKMSYESKEIVEENLKKNKVDIIKTKLSKRPAAKGILIDTKDNDRIILSYRGQNAYLEESDINYEDLHTNNFYFTSLTGTSFKTLISLAKKIKKKSTTKICYNPSLYLIQNNQKEVQKLIKLVDILVLNLEEAQEITSKISVSDCLDALSIIGPKTVVITCGALGAYCKTKNDTQEYFQKALSSKVVDTTGAGDAFAATFFYYTTRNYSVSNAMNLAAKNSASVVAKVGTTDGLLYSDDLK
jgi:phosphoglycerate kinase